MIFSFISIPFSNGRAKVTGVEMDEKWCAIQEKVINTNEYLLSVGVFMISNIWFRSIQNVSIVCSDIRTRPDLLASANTIVMNNVFSFFLSVEEQVDYLFNPGDLVELI